MKNTEAVIVVDYQNTFVQVEDGGTGELGVSGAGSLAPYINSVVNETRSKGGLIINTLDYHQKGHMSLASTYNGKKPITEAFALGINPIPVENPEYFITEQEVQSWDDEHNNVASNIQLDIQVLQGYISTIGVQALWPDHAIAGEKSSKLFSEYDTQESDINIYKGESLELDSYSGFGGNTHDESGNQKLDEALKEFGIKTIKIVGLATDYCVGSTASDANKNGYETEVLSRGIAGVAPESSQETLENLSKDGVKIIN